MLQVETLACTRGWFASRRSRSLLNTPCMEVVVTQKVRHVDKSRSTCEQIARPLWKAWGWKFGRSGQKSVGIGIKVPMPFESNLRDITTGVGTENIPETLG